MKRSAAVLGILCLLLLSGCRVQPGGEEESTATPPPMSTAPSPVETENPPAEPATDAPAETVIPAPTGTESLLPEPEPPPAREELEFFARDWCSVYRGRFALYDALHLERSYWFMDYDPAQPLMSVEFRSADGAPGDIWFQRYDEPQEAPAEVAKSLLGAMGVDAEVLTFTGTQDDRDAALARQIADRAAEAGMSESGALELFLEAASQTPGLDENMWCYVDLTGTSYLLMAYGSVYRIQRLDALAEYASSPEFVVRQAFDEALMAYRRFGPTTLPADPEDSVELEGVRYNRVEYPGLSSILELRTYLKTLFSDEIVDILMDMGYYTDVNGILYAASVNRPFAYVADGDWQVLRESGTKLVYRFEGTLCRDDPAVEPWAVTLDFPYEQVGDKWVFTEFSWPD